MGATVSSKGQIVIPQKYRQALGITTGSRVDFDVHDNVLELRVVRKKHHTRLEDGCGMLKSKGKALLPDFDAATLFNREK